MRENWKRDTLENLLDALIDYRGKTPKKVDSGIPLVTAKIVKDGFVQPYTEYIAEKDYSSWMTRGFPKVGDVVLTTEAPLGEVAQLTDANVALAQRIVTLRGKQGVLHNGYLKYFLFSELGQSRLKARESGSTVTGIKQSELRLVEIDFPSYEEQENIAKILGDIDEKISLNSQINQTLESMAQALFKSWFIDFDPVRAKVDVLEAGGTIDEAERAAMMTISGKDEDALSAMEQQNPEAFENLRNVSSMFSNCFVESELGLIPEGWSVSKVSDISTFASGKIHVERLTHGNYISTENMLQDKGGITISSSLPSVSSTPDFKKGNILISNIRPYFKKIWLATFDGGRSNDVLCFKVRCPGTEDYLFHLLYQDRFFAYMMASSKGSKMPRGDKDSIMNFSFPYSQPLAKCFAKIIREYNEQVAVHKNEIHTLSLVKNALLPELLFNSERHCQ